MDKDKEEVKTQKEKKQTDEQKPAQTTADTEQVAQNFPQNAGNNSQASELSPNGQSDYR